MSGSEGKTLPFSYQFLAGAVAGVCEISVMYPLDVVKTRFQQQSATASNGAHYTGIVNCFKRIISEEGVSTLYRGIVAPIAVEAPKRAMKFATQKEFTKLVRNTLSDRPGDHAQLISIISGTLTGITEACLVSSFELVKIRMQDKANHTLYKNTSDCVRKIWKTEGAFSFLRGIESACWRNGSWNGAYFGMIHTIRSNLPQNVNKPTASEEAMRNFLAGTIGGILATTVNTPFDVVKTRIQSYIPTSSNVSRIYTYNWAWSGVYYIARTEGIRGLYRGFLPKVLRLGPGGGILLVVFDIVSTALKKYV